LSQPAARHTYGLSVVCTCECFFRSELLAKRRPQPTNSHLNGLSPAPRINTHTCTRLYSPKLVQHQHFWNMKKSKKATELHCHKKYQSKLGRATSPPLTHRIPLVTTGCLTFRLPLKLPSSPLTISTHLIHPSATDPTPPKQHPDRISRFTTVHPPDTPTNRPTDRQTYRPTDAIDDKSVLTPVHALLIL